MDAAAYALGALEPAEAEAFREHLARCAVCQEEVETFEDVVRALPMAAAQYQAPDSVRRRVMRELKPEHRTSPGPHRVGLVPRTVAAAAVLALAVLGGTQLASSPRAGPTHVYRASLGRATVRISDDRAELVVKHLRQPGAGRTYEVWFQHGNRPPRPTSVLFDVDRAGRANVIVPGSVHGVSRLLVTAEPAGGTRVPTTTPVIVASLT